jgi:small GTP-binding protein
MKRDGLITAKVILVGDAFVGKTSIIQQYATHAFDPACEPTIGASFIARRVETVYGTIEIQIWDTAGQERFRSLIPMYSRNATACLLVLDLSNLVSYEHLEMWLGIVQENCSPHCHVYVVGNKSDLSTVVPIPELEQWCKSHNFDFFRTSAQEYETVARIFETVAVDAARNQKTDPSVPHILEDAGQGGCC